MGEGGGRKISTGSAAAGNPGGKGLTRDGGRLRDNSDVQRREIVRERAMKGYSRSTGQHKEKKKTEAQKERNFASRGRKHCCV